MGFLGSGGYDISSSTSDATTQRDDPAGKFAIEPIKPRRVAVAVPEPKPPVRVGSLPKIPVIVWHVVLAIVAAGIVHLVIHFYNYGR